MEKDCKLFLDIHMGKYLNENNLSEFENVEQRKLVIEIITAKYNEVVASDTLRLNNLIENAKVAWFNSIEIDYDNKTDVMEALELYENEIEKYKGFSDEEIESNLEIFNDNLYFLPEDSTRILIQGAELLAAY